MYNSWYINLMKYSPDLLPETFAYVYGTHKVGKYHKSFSAYSFVGLKPRPAYSSVLNK